jgi:hypothetical protein
MTSIFNLHHLFYFWTLIALGLPGEVFESTAEQPKLGEVDRAGVPLPWSSKLNVAPGLGS